MSTAFAPAADTTNEKPKAQARDFKTGPSAGGRRRKAAPDTTRDYLAVARDISNTEARLTKQRATLATTEAELSAFVEESIALVKTAGKRK